MPEEMTSLPPRAHKPRFRMGTRWIVVRHVRPGADEVYAPGDVLPDRFRRHYLQYLWRANKIGPEGDPWTEYMLASYRLSEQRIARTAAARAAAEESPSAVDEEPAKRPEEEGAWRFVEVNHVGSGWYVILADGKRLARLRGTEAVNAWLSDHGYAEMPETKSAT